MLSQQELSELTDEERREYENASKVDQKKMEQPFRELGWKRRAARFHEQAQNSNAPARLRQAEMEPVRPEDVVEGAKEYRIFTSHDKGLFGKFDAESIEAALNNYAAQGWVVVGATTATFRGIVAAKDEMIIILERSRRR